MLEEGKETQATEAEEDEDDGTFTNISLADDAGKASRDYAEIGLVFSAQ